MSKTYKQKKTLKVKNFKKRKTIKQRGGAGQNVKPIQNMEIKNIYDASHVKPNSQRTH